MHITDLAIRGLPFSDDGQKRYHDDQLPTFGFIIALPSMFVFPPIAVIGLGMMYGGYLLRRNAREMSMRRQQGRGS